MYISVFEIFKIGVGPSSSHTVGPIRAANEFVTLLSATHVLNDVAEVKIALYGSLALTGKGHGTDKAVVIGLMGEHADTADPDTIPVKRQTIEETGQLLLGGTHPIRFKEADHILFHYTETLPKHTNGMRFTAYDANQQELASEIYYSVGGGFVVTDAQFGQSPPEAKPIPFPFTTADSLFALCLENNISISELMMANEMVFRTESEIKEGLLRIADTMEACIRKGCQTEGILPGGLHVHRRAAKLYHKIISEKETMAVQHHTMNWLNACAMAVNEENAAGGRVVTAPTNGAAGIIPAVLQYYKEFCPAPTEQGIVDFLLTAENFRT